MIKLGNNNIGKIYLGSNVIGKAYLGSNLVYQSGGGPSPQPTTIPYIRGGVGSYIDTGITADSTTRVVVWARNFNPNSTVLFGSRIGGTEAAYGLFAPGLQNIGSLRFDFGTTQNHVSNSFPKMSGYHKYELDGNRFLVDDNLLGTATSSSFSNNLSIYLFAINTNGTKHDSTLPIDICACKIYKNNTLVRDFSAVNSPSVGLYDSVSGTTFTNAGSGSFTYGTFERNAYTPLEYISCDGNQYFDSGVYGTYSQEIVSKFMPTNTTAKWNSLLGYRNTTNCCDVSFGTATAGEDNMRIYWRFGTNSSSSQAFSGSTTNKLTNQEVVIAKTNGTLYVYKNNSQVGYATINVSSSFQTEQTLGVGRRRATVGFTEGEGFDGRIYFVGFGAAANFAPAKVNNVAGMYDTYNDVFYPSSGTDFTAGPEL